ncbi:thioredoxin domain-containing protein [Bombella sp. ESL0378]|uniref:thioredoxin domain-containing protein n=1 Tax=unclassified Bombella TaxID=2644098 RepID=UPI0012D8BD97|nr:MULTISPECIES: thioredoxin domain-containing protein [unclassified Bombella]MUG04736.1 thioredoxin domain-containing protein [Bombella sp. ESL0378]MUG90278.1 thioredoxin domain-containing protein [Bombella sp. ESL0385]
MSTQPSLSRRNLLIGGATLLAAPFITMGRAHAQAAQDPRMGPRIIGNPQAPILVQEWFSLTCTHCAHFATELFPKIKEQFIDTGKIRFQFHDFPLDQVALIAAMVARSLPEERYVPFIESLFSRQMQWAFSGNDPVAHLKQEAALAGIAPAEFDKISKDMSFGQALYQQTQKEGQEYDIKGTPYFRFNNTPYAQDPETVEKFAELVSKA